MMQTFDLIFDAAAFAALKVIFLSDNVPSPFNVSPLPSRSYNFLLKELFSIFDLMLNNLDVYF